MVHLDTQGNTLFERVGGDAFFGALADRFYAAVEQDPLLRSLYPADLGPPSRHLALFLAQYWGGPRTYSDVRGHPRLRMRHVPFRIGQAERDAWLCHMRAAVESSSAAPADAQTLLDYFETASTSLINEPA
ncbi:MAG: globin [Chloroflexi bacterium]|nr:globin [Chloroflexota bacterium]